MLNEFSSATSLRVPVLLVDRFQNANHAPEKVYYANTHADPVDLFSRKMADLFLVHLH
jgi:hypothetical protein